MECPRCHLALRTVDYEGVEVDVCDGCWGFWLDTGELEQILEKQELVFSDAERKTILDAQSASRPGDQAPAGCPHCGEIMERAQYDESVRLVIDRCPTHGLWLDTGEIKKIQAVAETSAKIHRMLLRKLGLRRY